MKIETEDYIAIGTWARREQITNRETAYELINRFSIPIITIDGKKFIHKDIQDPRKIRKGLIAPRHLVVNNHFVQLLEKMKIL